MIIISTLTHKENGFWPRLAQVASPRCELLLIANGPQLKPKTNIQAINESNKGYKRAEYQILGGVSIRHSYDVSKTFLHLRQPPCCTVL